jgi:hypothetical protein
MRDKAFYIIIFMYFASFGMLAGQYLFADPFGYQITNFEGVTIKDEIFGFLNVTNVNTITGDIADAQSQSNSTLDAVENSFNLGLNIGFLGLQILTGTVIFNILYIFGIPAIFIAGMVVIYAFLLVDAIIARIRGI